MAKTQEFTISLWFDNEAEEAARFYTSIFNDGVIGKIHYYGKEGFEFHRRPEGSVMTVDFVANGINFQALNGGPQFKFNESVSFVITCDTQKEVDYFWEKLTGQGGKEVQCGWLKDKFGVSWQIVPRAFQEMMDRTDKKAIGRAMNAMFQMKKLDIQALERAYQGHA